MLSLLTFVTVALAGFASAQTSLFVPGFDPQALTANEIGVGADGETTWLIAPGVSSGSFDQDGGFVGTATLIEGASTVEAIWADPDAGFIADEKCVINGAEADCTILSIDPSGVVTRTMAVETESVVPFEVQVGGSAAVTSGGSVPTAGSSPASGASQTQGASETGSGSQTASTSTSASATPSDNGVAKLGWSSAVTLISGAGVAMMLLA